MTESIEHPSEYAASPERLSDAMQRVFGRLLDDDRMLVSGISQTQAREFFEEVVLPAVTTGFEEQNKRLAAPRDELELQRLIRTRTEELTLYSEGKTFKEIGELTEQAPPTVIRHIGIGFNNLKSLELDADYWRSYLKGEYESISFKQKPKPEAPRGVRRRRQLGQAALRTSRLRGISEADEETEGYLDEEGERVAELAYLPGATNDAVKDWLRKIGKVPLINAEKEVELSKRIEAGLYAAELLKRSGEMTILRREELEWVAEDGIRAKTHMLEANLRLVVSLAKRYSGRGMQFLDLIQEGHLGLIRAVEKFDYTKGYKFSTYSTWWIRQAIARGMADQARTVRLPVHVVEVINKMSRVRRQMLQDLGREATPEELAKELDIKVEKILELQKYQREPIALETPLGDGSGTGPGGHESYFGDLIEDGDAINAHDAAAFSLLQQQLHAVLDTLPEREAGVISMRYGLDDGQPKTLDEIGKVYGVTRERIRQIEGTTMAKLRHPSRSDALKWYLDLDEDKHKS